MPWVHKTMVGEKLFLSFIAKDKARTKITQNGSFKAKIYNRIGGFWLSWQETKEKIYPQARFFGPQYKLLVGGGGEEPGGCWREMLERLLAECAQGYRWDIQSLSNEGRNSNYQSREYVEGNISQRIGSCLTPYFLLLCPMHSSPLPSTTTMSDFTSFMLILSNIQQETLMEAIHKKSCGHLPYGGLNPIPWLLGVFFLITQMLFFGWWKLHKNGIYPPKVIA